MSTLPSGNPQRRNRQSDQQDCAPLEADAGFSLGLYGRFRPETYFALLQSILGLVSVSQAGCQDHNNRPAQARITLRRLGALTLAVLGVAAASESALAEDRFVEGLCRNFPLNSAVSARRVQLQKRRLKLSS